MYNQPLAQTLALLIGAEEQRQGPHLGDREYATYSVLVRSESLTHVSDERKAELYALIVEHPSFNKFLADLALAVDFALERLGV